MLSHDNLVVKLGVRCGWRQLGERRPKTPHTNDGGLPCSGQGQRSAAKSGR